MKRYGSDSLAYFNTRWDKDLFFQNSKIFLAYRRILDVALVSGDPVGPPELVAEIMGEFRRFCAQSGWRLACLASKEDYVPLYRSAGLKAFFLGEEAVIRLDGFSLEGRRARRPRQAISKLQKMGATMEFMFNVGIPHHLRHDLERVSRDWLGDYPETGFSMGLGRLFDPEDPDCLVCIAYDSHMQPMGFLNLVPMYPGLGYSLDVVRTARGSPNGLLEFMVARTAEFLKRRSYDYFSLHFCFFSQHYREDREEPGSPLARSFARLLGCRLPIMSLYNFDKGFSPMWKKRYIIYDRQIDFLRIVLVAAIAESAWRLRNKD